MKKILGQFEKQRTKLIDASIKYGMRHPKVLEYSQELDKIHNKLQGLMMNK